MAEQAEQPSDDTIASVSLVGSQLTTYTQLVSMGFDQLESHAVAQTFGSNTQGAINCIISGNATQLMQQEYSSTHSVAEGLDRTTKLRPFLRSDKA